MLRVTEIAFGLEKNWNHRHPAGILVPWHLCLIVLIAGIFCGDATGIYQTDSIFPHIAFLAISGLVLTSLILTTKQIRKVHRKRHVAYWLAGWLTLWFAFGYWHAQPRNAQVPPENVTCQFTGTVESMPPDVTSIAIRLSQWQCGNTSQNGDIRVQMSLPARERQFSSATLAKGTFFSIYGTFSRFSEPSVQGMFNAQQWAHSRHLSGRITPQRDTAPVILQQSSRFQTKLENGRRFVYEKLSAVSPEGILPALILGSTRGISDETRTTFGHLGIAHVLAVSGLHFGIIAILIHTVFCLIFGRIPWVMRRFGKKRAASAAAIPALGVYLLFVGAPISAQRALLMAACCTFARLTASKSDRARSLCLAGIIILTIEPLAIFEVSFQLSFAAVLGIILGMEFYERELRLRIIERDLPKKAEVALCSLISMLIMTLSTSLTTAPVVIYHFGQLPILGILTNLVVIPYVSFILMPAAMIAAVCTAASIPGTQFVLDLAGMLENLLVQTASLFDRFIPLSYTEMTPHPVVILIAIGTSFALLYKFRLVKIRFVLAGIMVMAMSVCITISQIEPRFWTQTRDLRITFVDMGQADSTLIEFPDGHVMLIDAGCELGRDENAVKTRLLPYLKTQGIQRIDTLVVTHSDYDHTAGIPVLLQNIEVSEIWHNGIEEASWMQQTGAIPLVSVIDNPPEPGYHRSSLQILWPNRNSANILREQNALTPNESSIVMRLDYGEFSAIFAGDAGVPAEKSMLNRRISPVTVLKAGHHGSKSASSEAWIKTLHPQMAIFTASQRNRYKFPNIDVQSRLFHTRTRMFKTGDSGSIRMTTSGKVMAIETMR